jgi:hypothetical protein
MNLELEIARALSTHGLTGGGPNKPRPPRPVVQGRELTYDDVRDERIEVAAQHALVRMSKKTPAERQAANEMVAAIKSGQLAAIFQENQRAPALRARAAGGNWWEITRGRDASMQEDPYGIESPILVFRVAAANDPDNTRLDRALVLAWHEKPSPVKPSPAKPSGSISPTYCHWSDANCVNLAFQIARYYMEKLSYPPLRLEIPRKDGIKCGESEATVQLGSNDRIRIAWLGDGRLNLEHWKGDARFLNNMLDYLCDENGNIAWLGWVVPRPRS